MHHRKSQRQLTDEEIQQAWKSIHLAEDLLANFLHVPLSLTHADHVMTVTSKILEFNPDISSLYLLRRKAISTLLPNDARKALQKLLTPGHILESRVLTGESTRPLGESSLFGEPTLLEAELEFVKLLSPIKPIKAYSLWHHLCWILCASLTCAVRPVIESETFNPIPDSWTTISGSEFFDSCCGPDNWRHQTNLLLPVLTLFEKFAINELRKDGRNFHCWSFLTLIYRLMNDLSNLENQNLNNTVKETVKNDFYLERLGDLADAELDRTNYNNSSAFHARRIIDFDIATELSWLRHACLAVPEREGPWVHLECVIEQEILHRKYPMPIFRDLLTEFLTFLRSGWIEGEEPVPCKAQKAKKMLENLLMTHPLFLP